MPHAAFVRRSQPTAEHGPTVRALSFARSRWHLAHRFAVRSHGFQHSTQRPDLSAHRQHQPERFCGASGRRHAFVRQRG